VVNPKILDVVKQALEQHQKNYPSEEVYAAFDFDNTCILSDLGELAYVDQLQAGLYNKNPNYIDDLLPALPYKQRLIEILHRYHEVTDEEIRKGIQQDLTVYLIHAYFDFCQRDERGGYMFLIQLLKQITPKQVHEWIAYSVKRHHNKPSQTIDLETQDGTIKYSYQIGYQMNPVMDTVIRWLQTQQIPFVIVTGSLQPLIHTCAEKLWGISADQVIGMQSVIENDYYTGTLLEPVTYGEGKVNCLNKLFSFPPFLAAGDSNTDYPLLQYATSLRLVRDKGTQPFMTRVNQHIQEGEPWMIMPGV
jgi:phosphoserine phosphatase